MVFYMVPYKNLVNHLKTFDILPISQLSPKLVYVDGIPTLAKLLISLKAVVKSRKYQIGLL
jgi:hypothetical protein